MFLKIALGNILKNKRSTFTILFVVFISVFFMEFTVGYMDGFKEKIIHDAMNEAGHIKIYNKEYYKSLDFSPVDKNMPFNNEILNKIKSIKEVKSIRSEINFGAIANSEKENVETMVKAININDLSPYKKRINSITKGRFIKDSDEFVIGKKMANLLKVKIGDKIILLSVDQYGGMNAVEGKIVGLFNAHNPAEDESLVICSLNMAWKLLNLENVVTKYIVNINDLFNSKYVAEKIQSMLGKNFAVIPWEVSDSYIKDMIKVMDISLYIIGGIILFVAGLGITNSFLMNIMNRFPEFGVLRTLGVSKLQLFNMILSESFILGLCGSILGMIPGISLVYYFYVNPINYEKMAETLSSFEGVDAIIGTAFYLNSAIFVFITGILISIIASLYPAYIAIKKRPVDIMRVLQ